jgi:4-hydroxy-tetrahydrodipicolinate synthase
MVTAARRAGRFGAVVTAMATPFDADGRLDIGGAVTLARYLVDNGSDGLLVTGTTGEGPTLSDSERTQLWAAVARAVTVPVIAGSGTNDTAHSVELTRVATEAGAAGILAVTPYYNRPSQGGIAAHFAAVAAATSLPVLVYDIPVRTGRKVALDTMLQLVHDFPNIVGVKDASADPAGAARLMARAGAGFDCYSGDDSLTLPLLAVGAVGVVSVASHWVGKELGEMVRLYLEGDVEGARELNAALIDAVAFQSSDEAPNPLPAKAVLRARGLPAGECRLPMGPAPDWLEPKAGSMLANLDLWRSSRPARAGVTSANA